MQLVTVAGKWLNADKTEAIWIGSRAAINKIVAGPVTYYRYGENDQALRRRARP